jgi:hypothetical protein
MINTSREAANETRTLLSGLITPYITLFGVINQAGWADEARARGNRPRHQAHGRADGVLVRMTCYTADHRGTPAPSSEIEEIRWLGYRDRDRVSPVDRIIFDHLRQTGRLR